VLRPGGRLLLYEHAAADKPDRPEFAAWMRGTYLRRYPSPPRGAMAAAFDGRGRFLHPFFAGGGAAVFAFRASFRRLRLG
jgi:hypothetical protein